MHRFISAFVGFFFGLFSPVLESATVDGVNDRKRHWSRVQVLALMAAALATGLFVAMGQVLAAYAMVGFVAIPTLLARGAIPSLRGQAGVASVNMIVTTVVALIILASLAPTALDTFAAVDTSAWDTEWSTIFDLIPIFAVLAIAVLFFRFRGSRG